MGPADANSELLLTEFLTKLLIVFFFFLNDGKRECVNQKEEGLATLASCVATFTLGSQSNRFGRDSIYTVQTGRRPNFGE